MRVVIISHGTYLKQIISCLNENLDIANIIFMDRFFEGNCDVVLSNKKVKGSAYAYLKETVSSLYYDYILIGVPPKNTYEDSVLKDLKKYGISSNKIFRLGGMFINNLYNFSKIFNYIKADISKYKIFITGTSRTWRTVDYSQYELPIVSGAYSSQDLYFDYIQAKKLLSIKGNNFKYAVIGIEKYSFHYDESLSQSEDFMMLSYYLNFKDVHNYAVNVHDIELIFNDSFLDSAKNIRLGDKFNLNNFDYHLADSNISIQTYIDGRNLAEVWKNKKYPKTFIEYKNIFIDYIKMCREHSIIPIVVFFPTTTVYDTFFRKQQIWDECIQTIKSIRKDYPFIFLGGDFWKDFTDNDFIDCDHVNYRGAVKCSKKINDIIMKMEYEGQEFKIDDYLERIS